jgi:hypothetical protein
MSTSTDPRPLARIIAYNAKEVHYLRTVNIVTTQALDKAMHFKEYLQATAAQAAGKPNLVPTFMAAAASTKGLPTIYINGYSAPS